MAKNKPQQRPAQTENHPVRQQNRPASEQIERELARVEEKRRFRTVMRNTLAVLASVAAIAVLISTFLLPVMRVYSNAMTPTISENEILIAVKTKDIRRGDIIAFYYNNRILIRRVIAMPGETVSIDDSGTVYVNEGIIGEPYVAERALGNSDIEYPYRVPDDALFVLGDNRTASVDSRNTVVGCITQDQMVGKLLVCIWPFPSIRLIENTLLPPV